MYMYSTALYCLYSLPFLSLSPIPFLPWALPFPARDLGSAVSSPAGSGTEPRSQKQFWHIWRPENAPGDKHLGHYCVLQNAYGIPYIMWSSAAVTDMKFDLQKL